MLYVKALSANDTVFIEDTDDNTVDEISNRKLTELLKKKIVNIYGAYVYNDRAECTCLLYPTRLNYVELKSLVDRHRQIHNPWSLKPIEDYLATVEIDSHIRVHYIYIGDGDRRRHEGLTVLTKIDSDLWHYVDSYNSFSDTEGDSKYAAHFLDVACCSSLSYSFG